MISLGKAAEIFEHYLTLALDAGGVKITPDMREELHDAVESFRDAEYRLANSRERI